MSLETSTVDDVLAHFGVKGMKWGVRKRRQNASDFKEQHPGLSTDASVKTKVIKGPTPIQAKIVPGRPVQTRGGKRHPTVNDAIRSAALRQKLNASGKQSLTNDEIRFLVDRLTLETRLSQVAPKPKSKGRQWAEAFIKSPVPKIGINVAKSKLPEKIEDFTAQQLKIAKGLDFADKLIGTLSESGKKKKK